MEDMKSEVVIVGGGPVGLLLANLLGAAGIETVAIEKKERPVAKGRAIGVTPPSLGILRGLSLDGEFIERGVKVEKAFVHGRRGITGRTDFTALPGLYRFILSLPQEDTESILEANLGKFPSVMVRKGLEFRSLVPGENDIVVETTDAAGAGSRFACRCLCACDGRYSAVRDFLGMPFRGATYPDAFLMGDFAGDAGLGTEAHLFFTATGAVESFPLPGGRRRWIVQTERFMEGAAPDFIARTVSERTGIALHTAVPLSASPYRPERFMIRRYHWRGRVFFCGDAAHVMSPVGGQGMNTGFADARLCARALYRVLRRNGDAARYGKAYDRFRRKATAAAARRAWISMRIGTIRGEPASRLRDLFIRVLSRLLRSKIPPFFAMLTIPAVDFDAPQGGEESLFKADELGHPAE
jgi:2-polyprenyl-6-methoxyphenol hydroxylase-like FAD-dependent oxidoreductase